MEELVQDLVSALEQTSEQARLDDLWEDQLWEEQLWEELVFSPLQQRRVVRKRRGRKRRCDSVPHGPAAGRCLSEASESSLDEALARSRQSGPTRAALAGASAPVAAATQSDSDEVAPVPVPLRGGRCSRPRSDSVAEHTAGRPLRRRRRVRRSASEGTVRLQQRFRVSGLERREQTHHHHHHPRHHHHPHHHQRTQRRRRLGQLKRRPGPWPGQDVGAAVGGLAEECWRDKSLRQAREQREASDENLSECETSSVCSSDPGLFTTDEGRQGDDEQSDWFFEGECSVAVGAQSVLCGRESETAPRPAGPDAGREKPCSARFIQPAPPSHRGYHARTNRLPGVAVSCIRSGRRRLPGKDNGTVCVDKIRSCSQDSCQKELWMPSFGKRDRSQLKPLSPLSVFPAGTGPDSSCPRCPSAVCRNRQFHGPLGLQGAGDVKRRRKTLTGVPACPPFRKEFRQGESEQNRPRASPAGGDAAVAPSSATQTRGSAVPGPSHGGHGEHEDA
ncbi:G patch domain-containing protein 2-like [Brachyhypopomus gauderio]|uniref:G patch domain-containing protein 2-like n=1 Tax=Brachyhypopomus gauderio TaxID=698409 RepID=UPI004041A830